jgi:predicted DNA-binding mobile mystery protein A
MNKKKLQIERKLIGFSSAHKIPVPPTGWIKVIRVTLGMSLQQLANKLSITKQSVQEIEMREREGNISLKSLRETANALDIHLVYGLVPKDGSIDALIERKARQLAIQIVSRTSNTMKLEYQENTKQRLQKAIKDRTAVIKNELPKMLWD